MITIARKFKLTEIQARTLVSIHEHICKHGFPPSQKELADEYGLSSPNAINDRIKALVRKEFLENNNFRSRSISFTEKGISLLRSVAEESPNLISSVNALSLNGSDKKVMDDYLLLSIENKRLVADMITSLSRED